nr:DUF3857 domain-containing protein [uncultured Allomuricauda sp.]
MKFKLLLLFLFLYSPFSNAQKTVEIRPPSNWVNKVDYSDETSGIAEGSSQYLLIDFQDNIANQERYSHYVIKILNADGVQDMSDVTLNYDPAFQELTVHSVNLIRNGKTINKLKENKFNVIQRETSKERYLYDGSLTAVMNLSDVRAGDIIEYSYTKKGFNPINKGNFSFTYYQQYTLPVDRLYSRLVNGTSKEINLKLLDDALEPKISDSPFGKEYLWDSSGIDRILYDTNVPSWINTQKRVSISTFKNWNEIVNLISPLYQIRNNKATLPSEVLEGKQSLDDKVLALIRFVQDDVRYLGFESGIGAYKPNAPSSVISQRFGDCKDKSLLLVDLLRQQGVSAYPFLVNTYLRQEIKKLTPSLGSFDHCIVNFTYEGKDYFVDPTISNQGGNLKYLIFPKYGSGLRIKNGEQYLVEIPETESPSIDISETIEIDSIGGGASFIVETTYTGAKADYTRSYFNNNTQESINNEYLNFYSELYPSITSAGKISFTDDSKSYDNRVTVKESYYIEDFWSKSLENESLIYCETYPLVLESLINYTKSAKREMPYYLGPPYDFKQMTTIKLPEAWSASNEDFELDEPSFLYNNESFAMGNTIVVAHNYKLKKEVLEADAVPEFLKKHDEIFGQLNYQLTHLDTSATSEGPSWTAIIITILALILGGFMFWKLYVKYNPKPHETCQQMSIGGWLVLPAIGLTISPFVMLFQIFQEDYFSNVFWVGIENAVIENPGVLSFIVGVELLYNFVFLIFTILLIVLFYTKRTSLPKLIILFYALSFLVPFLESLALNALYPDLFSINDPSEFKDIAKSFVGAAIWIPYFLISTRVKKTFCKTYNGIEN